MTGRQNEQPLASRAATSRFLLVIDKVRSLLRWVLRGERNVSTSLEALSVNLRSVQAKVAWAEERLAALELTEDGQAGLEQRRAADAWVIPDKQSTNGVNLVGYLQRQLGIGHIARRLASLLTDNGVPTSSIAFGASASPVSPASIPLAQRIEFTNTIAVVAADQLPLLGRLHPEIIGSSERLIAYCFWELETLSQPTAAGAGLADEIWVATRFVEDAFGGHGVPVRRVPIPIERPVQSDRDPATFLPFHDRGDRLVFGVVFDHFSVMERKNPLAAITAFSKAFARDSGPLLIVKTLNARMCAAAHQRLIDAAADRPDIAIWDEQLSGPDQFAFMASFDVLVSLHRSEGLGLHLAEAMWMGVPVIATGYSGNMDFMDEDCAQLVGYSMTSVSGGDGIYPDGARWAEPDIDHAAELMARMARDSNERRRIGAAGRSRMEQQPSDSATARRVADLLHIRAI